MYIMQLSWHPVKENLIVYGTDDGRVGVYDILSSRFDFKYVFELVLH